MSIILVSFHQSIFSSIQIMRNIIGQITSLWDICRKERKNTNTTLETLSQSNTTDRTWRPWVSDYLHSKSQLFSLLFRNIFMHWLKYQNNRLLLHIILQANMLFDYSSWFVKPNSIWHECSFDPFLLRAPGVRLSLMIVFHSTLKIDVCYHKQL